MYKKRKVLLIIEGKYVWTYFVEDGETVSYTHLDVYKRQM